MTTDHAAAAREKLTDILELANSDSWKIGATVEEILAAYPQIAEAPPSGNEAVEAARDTVRRFDEWGLGATVHMTDAIMMARYILSLAAPGDQVTNDQRIEERA